jgi:hypothetical protein
MVTTALVSDAIHSGRTLLRWFDSNGLRIDAALWLYDVESEEWRFTLSSESLQRMGPKAAYSAVLQLFDANPHWDQDSFIIWRNIAVIPLTHPLIKALRATFPKGSNDQGIRLFKTVIDRVYVEDAYIYRLWGHPMNPGSQSL